MSGKHRNKRKHVPALDACQRAGLLYLYFVKKKTQAFLAIKFRIAQSTVSKYVAAAQ